MEPLSRHFFSPAPFPGRRRWLPATAKPTLNGTVKGDEAQVEIGLERLRCSPIAISFGSYMDKAVGRRACTRKFFTHNVSVLSL